MFNIFVKGEDELIIYKSTLVDAATCIIKNQDERITAEAERSLSEMFTQVQAYFVKNKCVRFQYLKHKDSDWVVFHSVNQFKVWLIEHQIADTFKLILQKLKDFYKKTGNPLPIINIVFGDYEKNQIYNTDMYFRNTFRPEWLEDEMIHKVIKSVDKSEVINGSSINSPVFGTMPPQKLSGGVKTLMLIYHNPEMIFNASTCGDNCAKWIEKFSKEKDFVISLYHTMHFSENNFRAYIVNADIVVDSYDEYVLMSDKYCRGQE